MYRIFLDAFPKYRSRVTQLTLSYTKILKAGIEVCDNVFFNEETGAVFVLVPEETKEEKAELVAGQVGPQGVIL